MTRELPTGTVTLLFTDVEGSTALLDELGAERLSDALGVLETTSTTALERVRPFGYA